MSFEPLKRILGRSIQSLPVSKELEISRVFAAWETILRHIWETERAVFITAVSFREGILTVESISPSAKQCLLLELPRLKNEINRHLGSLVVRSILVRSKGF